MICTAKQSLHSSSRQSRLLLVFFGFFEEGVDYFGQIINLELASAWIDYQEKLSI